MNDESRRWMEAGEVLAVNPHAKVACPRSADAILQVEDLVSAEAPDVIERVMTCPACGAWNVLRLRRSQKA